MQDAEQDQKPAVSRGVTRSDSAHGSQHQLHLTFLDGLRGLAALFVVLHHASYELPRHELKPALARATDFIQAHGHDAVAVFIVLSGFSLMLPVVRSSDGWVRGGTWDYLKRRAKRILPAYYATLAFSLALIACVPWMRAPSGVRWDVALPALKTDAILTHVFMVHNLHPPSIFRIDPPMWSVATEWQIYFLFPVFLVLWRRLGISMTIVAGFLTGYLVYLAMGPFAEVVSPWYAGLFTVGMAVAVFTNPSYRRSEHWGDRYLGVFAAGIALLVVLSPSMMAGDGLTGTAVAGLIAYCARHVFEGKSSTERPRILRLLESDPAVKLGTFSYSLYLVHFPLLSLTHGLLRRWGLGPNVRLVLLLTVGTSLCVAVAYVFYRLFERPFLVRSRAGADPQGEHGASRRPRWKTADPAPKTFTS